MSQELRDYLHAVADAMEAATIRARDEGLSGTVGEDQTFLEVESENVRAMLVDHFENPALAKRVCTDARPKRWGDVLRAADLMVARLREHT